MRRDRPWHDILLWCLFACCAPCFASCATVPEESPSTSHSLRSDPDKAGRFADWKRLIKTLPDVGGDACKAISQSREGNATAMVFPSACLFSPGATTVSESARSRSTIAEIARELSGVKDREFWIASRAPRTREAERVNSARAGALVSALIGAGVAANRLAAIVGVGFGEAGSSDSDPTGTALPPALAGAPLIEIVAAPAPMLLR